MHALTPHCMKTALHFGAGNIGRGFIGVLLNTSGFRVYFVDVAQTLIDSLSFHKSYAVRVVGTEESSILVNDVDALLPNDAALPKLFVQADIVTCAVGPSILKHIAPTIKTGIEARKKSGITQILPIIACENMVRATHALRQLIEEDSDKEYRAYMESYVSFLDCAVDRIVPTPPVTSVTSVTTEQTANTSTRPKPEMLPPVTVESFYEWIIEIPHTPGTIVHHDNTTSPDTIHKTPHARQNTSPMLKYASVQSIQGVTIVNNLMPYIMRKLLTVNTAHTFVAWLGQYYKKHTIADCMNEPHIYNKIRAICEETSEVLVKEYGLDAHEHSQYVSKILARFANPHLHDSVERVGRSPKRKLSYDERYVLPLRLAIKYNTTHDMLLLACALGLLFKNADDPEAQYIADIKKTTPIQTIFMELSGIKDRSIASSVEALYHSLSHQSDHP